MPEALRAVRFVDDSTGHDTQPGFFPRASHIKGKDWLDGCICQLRKVECSPQLHGGRLPRSLAGITMLRPIKSKWNGSPARGV